MKNKGICLGLLAIMLAFGFLGCDNGTGNGNVVLSKMNITDATNIFIAPASATAGRSARNSSSGNKLFKITEDGYVQEVTYVDEGGNPVSSTLSPTSLIILSNDYLIVSFGYNNNYLVNSNTGACYIYTNDLPNPNQNKTYYMGEYIGLDKSGNIYFISSPSGGNGPVRKLSISNVNNVNISTVSAPNDSVMYFGVDEDGNIGYEAFDSGNNKVLRYWNSAGLHVLPGNTNHSFTTFWAGFNGKLFYYNCTNLGNSRIKEISPSPYSVIDYGTNDWGGVFNMGIGMAGLLKINNANRIIAYNQTGLLELYNEQENKATGIPISTFGLASIKFGIASNDYYYLAGISSGTPKSVLVRINPLNNNYITLIDGGYDIYKMTVGNDNVVTFNALASNLSIVVGQVSTSSDLEILDVNLDSEVTVLERIR